MQALEMSRDLARRGHMVRLACLEGSRLEEEAEGLPVSAFRLTGPIHPLAVGRLAGILRTGVDILHSQHSRDLHLAVPALHIARSGIPLLLSKRVGSYVPKRDLFHRYLYRRVQRVLAVSEVIRTNVLATTPLTPDRVLTLHDAVDTARFHPSRGDRSRIRTEFGIAPGTVCIGCVGRFSPGKGHEDLLHAAAMLRSRGTAFSMLIAGEASRGEEAYERSVRSLCAALGLEKVVVFAGFRRDVPDLMAAFDIFAFPSHAEAFGVGLIEAMALERPVVSTDCDGVLDIVQEGETGLRVSPRNAAALAQALERLIRDPALRASMGKAGRSRVERFFDRTIQTDRLEALYAELLAGTRTPGGSPTGVVP